MQSNWEYEVNRVCDVKFVETAPFRSVLWQGQKGQSILNGRGNSLEKVALTARESQQTDRQNSQDNNKEARCLELGTT